ncbi:unnamed protein product [Adineta ricciae]|uniref:Helitron helicase-like domain-containing protein n=1 Tax=Adineta ricciae TaxID=249248 RepID=A0A815BJA3_ADIRI|nr:unnamed protein product [Adineta ricciae]CAF1270678.1 unnamed protein product [Adineta ricciae]
MKLKNVTVEQSLHFLYHDAMWLIFVMSITPTRTYEKHSNKGSALRTHIHALIFNQGLPSIFLTLNPADIHSPVALYFADIKPDLDNAQAEQLMDTYRRAEIIGLRL